MRTPLLAVPERVARLTGRDAGFAAPAPFSGEQVPRTSGLQQLVMAAELSEVRSARLPGAVVRPAGQTGQPPCRGRPRGAGQLIDGGGDPLHDRSHPGQVDDPRTPGWNDRLRGAS